MAPTGPSLWAPLVETQPPDTGEKGSVRHLPDMVIRVTAWCTLKDKMLKDYSIIIHCYRTPALG